ncbi:hypothetical protein ACI7BZ_20125 [Xanthobacter sp. AM11]|uniref:hypothetical protein n=1 Tax=Xanthobacter sp. AM11 TaxID=3380643 RepID=UPI0039BF035D
MNQTAFIGLLVAILLIGAAWWTQRKTRRLMQFESHADKFNLAARKLLRSNDVPEWVVRILGFLNGRLTSQRFAWAMVWCLATRDSNPAIARRNSDDFLRRHPELARLLGQAALNAMLALSYRSGIAGWVIRHFIFVGHRTDEPRAEELAESLSARLCADAA